MISMTIIDVQENKPSADELYRVAALLDKPGMQRARMHLRGLAHKTFVTEQLRRGA